MFRLCANWHGRAIYVPVFTRIVQVQKFDFDIMILPCPPGTVEQKNDNKRRSKTNTKRKSEREQQKENRTWPHCCCCCCSDSFSASSPKLTAPMNQPGRGHPGQKKTVTTANSPQTTAATLERVVRAPPPPPGPWPSRRRRPATIDFRCYHRRRRPWRPIPKPGLPRLAQNSSATAGRSQRQTSDLNKILSAISCCGRYFDWRVHHERKPWAFSRSVTFRSHWASILLNTAVRPKTVS